MKKVGIIGSGVVGKALAKGFLQYGYAVTIASRSAEKRAQLQQEIPQALVDGFEATATWADLVVLAVKGNRAKEALLACGIANLSGKTVIDTNNPIADEAPQNGVLRFFTTNNDSLMEQLQAVAPDVHLVKAFSCVGSALMINPDFGGIRPTMFICGNYPAAKQEVSHILLQFGWDIEDMGSAEAARAIEALCILWCIPGFTQNRWNHAFKLLNK